MSCDAVLYIDNNNVVELRNLINAQTGAIDTSAQVSCTLYDPLNAQVAGVTWPLPMAHAGGGTYRVTLPILILKAGRKYRLEADAIGSSSGELGHWETDIIAAVRPGND